MARRLPDEARSQIDLLIEEKEAVFSDFYSYRYFATEGFLPGYNFPRLPLRAYIPGRQVKRGRTGFELDTETGYWAAAEEDQDETSIIGESPRGIRKTVIPYVEDHRNCLLFSFARIKDMDIAKVASLAAALKRAVQVEFQLEDNELAVEPLPDSNNRKQLLFYEAAEGGVGVLRLLIDEPGALSRVAATALKLCHFDPISGENLERDKSNDDVCEAACYDCLMSYYNQGDHLLLDRMLIKDFLIELKQAQVKISPGPVSSEQHLQQLQRLAGSELEKQWLRFLDKNKFNLPTRAQKLIESCHTRPDFWYQEGGKKAAIYIDGPFHQYPERQKRDQEQEECLEDIGIRVIRFKHTDQWNEIVTRYPDVFRT